MGIHLTDDERVLRDGEHWAIGDKCYSENNGVVYLKEIILHGVHFGFSARVSGCLIDDEDTWLDSRVLSKEMPAWATERAEELRG